MKMINATISAIPKLIPSLIEAQEKRNYKFVTVLFFCVFVGLTRGLMETLFFGIKLKNSEYLAFIPFYLHLAFLLTVYLNLFVPTAWPKIIQSVLIGIFLGLFPPIIDLIAGSKNVFYGYYFLWNFERIPWLAYDPSFNFPFGEAATVWLSIFFATLYVFIKTKSALKTAAAGIGAYIIFLFNGMFLPMIVTRLISGVVASPEAVQGRSLGAALEFQRLPYYIAAVQVWVTMVWFFLLRRNIWPDILKRSVHTLPFLMLVLIGAALTGGEKILVSGSWFFGLDQALIGPLSVIVIGGFVSIAQNDYFDAIKENKPISERILTSEDVVALNSFSLLACLFFLVSGYRWASVGFVIFVVTVFYNYPFYRAKERFPANLKVEGIWALSSFLTGALVYETGKLDGEILWLAFFAFGGWSLFAGFKDFKDILTDRRAGNRTLYTLAMARGIRMKTVHRIYTTLAAIGFALPVIYLGDLAWILILAVGGYAPMLLVLGGKRGRMWFLRFLVAISVYLFLFWLGIVFTTTS